MTLARALLISVAAGCLYGCCTGERVHPMGDGGFQAIDGSVLHPLKQLDNGAVVLIFITADCPISNGYAPEINNLAERCGPGVETWGTSLYLVHVEPDITIERARQHAKDYRYLCPVLLDPRHELVNAVGATVTPEAAVIDRHGRLAYLGRIDDQYVDLGKKRLAASEHDLRDAIDSVSVNQKPTHSRTIAVGCYISEVAAK